MQTDIRAYANVSSQSEVIIRRGEGTDKIDINPPAIPKLSSKPKGVTPLPKPTYMVTTNGPLIKVFVICGIAYYGP